MLHCALQITATQLEQQWGAKWGKSNTHTHRKREGERCGAREGDRVRERELLCVEESCSSIGSIFCVRGHTRSAVPGRGKCLGNRMFKVKKRMCSALNPAPTLEASSCCYVDRVTGGRSRRWQHWMYHRRRRRRGTRSEPAVTEAAPYNLFSAHQRVSLALSLSLPSLLPTGPVAEAEGFCFLTNYGRLWSPSGRGGRRHCS